MSEMGKAMMGTGEASGEERAIKAAEAAITNPLLDHTSMSGAKGVLINITGGKDMTLYEVDSAANRIREEVVRLTMEQAEKLVKERLTKEDNNRLVEEFIEKMGSLN